MHTSKVVWLEGMFLRPQHFQQHDRFLVNYAEMLLQHTQPFAWGINEVKIDRQLLLQGKIALNGIKGVFPDGTPFSAPANDPLPPILTVPENARDQIIYLAIPLRRIGAVEAASEAGGNPTRYAINPYAAPDMLSKNFEVSSIQTATLNMRLICGEQDLAGYASIPVFRVLECNEDKSVRLDEQFIPPCLDFSAAEPLRALVGELAGLLHHRGEALSARILNGRLGGSAEIADYLMLQAVNRYEPVIANLEKTKSVHPFNLHSTLLTIAGELATFSAKNKRPTEFPAYQHADLNKTFSVVVGSLRQSLSSVIEQNAIPLQWVERKFGIRVAPIADRSLIDSCTFIIAAKAELSPEKLRGLFTAQAKIGPVEQISQLVNLQLPGITLLPLAVAPRQIPYRSGFVYYELDKNCEYWRQMRTSGGFAMHIAEGFAGLELEFWAVRD